MRSSDINYDIIIACSAQDQTTLQLRQSSLAKASVGMLGNFKITMAISPFK